MNKRKLLGQQIYFGSECVTSFEKQLFKKWLWKLEWLKKKKGKKESSFCQLKWCRFLHGFGEK